MNLVIIGVKGVDKMKDTIGKNYDNMDINTFNSLSSFGDVVLTRKLSIDRILLLQDGVLCESDPLSRLKAFSDYIAKHHPLTRIITISKTETTLEMMYKVFPTSLYANLLFPTIKRSVLLDLVKLDIETVRKSYISSDIKTTFEKDVDAEILEDIQPKQKQEPQQEKKKKKGLIGKLFGKKDKENSANLVEDTDGTVYEEVTFGDTDQLGDLGSFLDTGDLSEDLGDSDFQFEGVAESLMEDVDDFLLDGGVRTTEESEEDTEDEDNTPQDLLASDFSSFDTLSDTYDFNNDNEFGNSTEDIIYDTQAEDDISFEAYEPTNDGGIVEVEDIVYSNPLETELGYEPEIEDEIDMNGIIDDFTENEEETVIESIDIKQTAKVVTDAKKSIKKIKLDKDISDLKQHKVNTVVDEIDDEFTVADLGDDFDDLVSRYDESNTKVVERIVEVKVNGGGKKNFKNGIRVIIVTGDRRSGVTRTALNLAGEFANQAKTLYVDFDIVRHGSLIYLGLDAILEEPEQRQSGITHLNSVKTLENVTHFYTRGNFECLLGVFGDEATEGTIEKVQQIITLQRSYKNVIIDCPIEYLHCLEDISVYAEVLVCSESNITGVLNTVSALCDLEEENKIMTLIFNNSYYLVTKGNDTEEFNNNVEYIADTFSLDESKLNWGSIPVIGTVKELKSIALKL